MKISLCTVALVAFAAEGALASSWFSKAAYNKWHETELERWLSDHNVAYPAAADRKELVDLVNKNWEENVATPYNTWDSNQLYNWLTGQGQKVAKDAEANKESLVAQVKKSWSETADQASDAYSSVSNWLFDSWTDSQLKSFLDYHKIPNPSPRNRDSMLSTVRGNYQSIADKIKETAAYPGDWLYQSWSDSDLKAWCDARNIPVPQLSKRNQLIALVRRNSRTSMNRAGEYASAGSSYASSAGTEGASSISSAGKVGASSASSLAGEAAKSASSLANKGASSASSVADWAVPSASSLAAKGASSASSAAASAYSVVNAAVFDTWTESEVKNWADKNGLKVPQGSKLNEMRAWARKNYASLTGDTASASAASAYGAATTSAGNLFAQATADIYYQGKQWYDWAMVKVGRGSDDAISSLSSVSSAASSYASSLSSVAEKSASSASKAASKSGGNISSAMSSARLEASRLASVASRSASASARSASSSFKNEL